MNRRRWIAVAASLTIGAFLPAIAVAKEAAPLSVDGATTVSVAEAKELFDQGALFIDPRGDADFDAGRIPGAVHLPLDGALSEASLSEVAGKDETLVFYCNGVKCGVSSKACAKAIAWGFTDIRYFREGLPGWEGAGLPIE
jgi:rhodanese-related sulfurtransferase